MPVRSRVVRMPAVSAGADGTVRVWDVAAGKELRRMSHGGAVNDLAWLNDYELARFICLSPVPVFTGIGHERDNTMLDEVAHQRFDTPSKVIAGIEAMIVKRAREAQAAFDEVAGLAGAQFALPEAVELLRAPASENDSAPIAFSTSDPANVHALPLAPGAELPDPPPGPLPGEQLEARA